VPLDKYLWLTLADPQKADAATAQTGQWGMAIKGIL